jgi:hypothetical protein
MNIVRKWSVFAILVVVIGASGQLMAQVENEIPASPDTPRPKPAQSLLPPPLVTDTYAAKFVCGVAGDTNITHQPDAEAGRYATVVNLFNNTGSTVTFRKKAILLTLSEHDTAPGPIKLVESIQDDHALKVTCEDIYYLIGFFHHVNQIPPFMEGYVVFEVFSPFQTSPPPPDPLDVQAVYTYRSDLPAPTGGNGVSINVVRYPVTRNAHLLH